MASFTHLGKTYHSGVTFEVCIADALLIARDSQWLSDGAARHVHVIFTVLILHADVHAPANARMHACIHACLHACMPVLDNL